MLCKYLVVYSRSNNLNRTYDVIYELFRSKKGTKPLSQNYADFKTVFEKQSVVFYLCGLEEDASSMGATCVLAFLESLPCEFTSPMPQAIGVSTVNSLSKTYRLLHKHLSRGASEPASTRVS